MGTKTPRPAKNGGQALNGRAAKANPESAKSALAALVERAGMGPAGLMHLVQMLAHQLVEDHYAKLDQAGHADDEGIPLRRVFIDLFATDNADGPTEKRKGLIAELLAKEPVVLGKVLGDLRPRGLFSHTRRGDNFIFQQKRTLASFEDIELGKEQCAGFVIVGGPGQGKSTLSQLACQAHRAALLIHHQETLTAQERRVLADFIEPEEAPEWGEPVTPSLPVRIVLPDSVGFLMMSGKKETPMNDKGVRAIPQLVEYWHATLPDGAKAGLSAEDLLKLLKCGPFLLVLDGLDEVSAPGARSQVTEAIRELCEALHGARGLVLATTRPQGYGGELEEVGVRLQTRHLASLSVDRALSYSKRLLRARILNGKDRETIFSRLTEASKESATRRLMTTPLQVTILADLLKKSGKPPRDRWNLFARYYDVMYSRELAKPTDTAELLNSHKEHIHKIHSRAGLLLQVEAEQEILTPALLSRDKLASIADAVLSEEGFPSAERPALIERILLAASNRLVFLVQSQQNFYGFEIRSLQEFMAAAALSEKNEAATKARLAHIAKAGTFRNVTLFLTGKLLAESGDLRDVIAKEICPGLENDPNDEVGKVTRAGSVLALEILEDGAALSQPKRAEDLLRVAMSVMDLPANEVQVRLANLLSGERSPAHNGMEALLRDGIQSRLMPAADTDALNIGAWMTLLTLVEAGEKSPGWAKSMADAAWPESAIEQRNLIEAISEDGRSEKAPFGDWIKSHVNKHLGLLRIGTVVRMMAQQESVEVHKLGDHPLGLLLCWRESIQHSQASWTTDKARYRFPFTSIETQEEPLASMLGGSSQNLGPWLPCVLKFVIEPNARTLARTLRVLAKEPRAGRQALEDDVPWPLKSLLSLNPSDALMSTLADAAERGELGDTVSWREAEQYWRSGFETGDFFYALTDETASGRIVASRFPLWILEYRLTSELQDNDRDRFGASIFKRIAASNGVELDWCDFLAGVVPKSLPTLFQGDRTTARKVLLNTTTYTQEILGAFIKSDVFEPEDFDKWGRTRPDARVGDGAFTEVAPLATMFTAKPALEGLLALIAGACRIESTPSPISPELLARDRFSDPLVRADAWLIRLYLNEVKEEDLPTLFADIQAAKAQESDWPWHIFYAMLNHPVPAHGVSFWLVHPALRMFPDVAAEAFRLVKKRQQSRPAGLRDPDIWNRLELPLPYPGEPPPTSSKPTFDFQAPPIVLEKLTLQNVRSLEHLNFEFSPPLPNQGQWVVLLGENGAGKTTLLRSIVLALRNLADLQIWPKDTFASNFRRIGMNPTTDACRITLTLGNGVTYETSVHKNGKEIFNQSPQRSSATPAPCLMWAYGCRRGSALGGVAREVDVTENNGPDIATLFDEGAPLIHAQTWLQTLDGEASRDKTGRMRHVFNSVIAALKLILDVSEVHFDEDSNVVLTGPNVGSRVPLAALSDGYLTTAGWVLDLLARWIARAKKADVAIDSDFPEKMTGLVLLDEVDLHLHPAWQLKVIPRVRDIFKRLTFVVTTHNPLTIVGARPEEIWVLRRENGDTVAERKGDIPATLTAAQIYSRFFGIQEFFPSPEGAQLQRYGFLCGNPYRSAAEEKEMASLRKALASKGIHPGWTELPREVAKQKTRGKTR